ncbi:hypothetical protein KSP40_PGU006554 [Platanthera guangdongensis]|uniref:Uncharacterized protein n=1 Tax=Platanthera guangdongensis TaxID=2320717 RepID=A0ABR2MCU4_9ASPA
MDQHTGAGRREERQKAAASCSRPIAWGETSGHSAPVSRRQAEGMPHKRYYDTYLPFLLEACNDVDGYVRQASVYGIGVCAEFGGSVFCPLIGVALISLNNVIKRADALNSDNIMAYDNAVSSLGKICHFHRSNINAAQVCEISSSCSAHVF